MWPRLVPSLHEFFSSHGAPAARLCEGAAADAGGAGLVSGRGADAVAWAVLGCDPTGWAGLWLAGPALGGPAEMAGQLCELAEFGADALPEWAAVPGRQWAATHLAVRRSAVKLLLLGERMGVADEKRLPETTMARVYRLAAAVANIEEAPDAHLAGMVEMTGEGGKEGGEREEEEEERRERSGRKRRGRRGKRRRGKRRAEERARWTRQRWSRRRWRDT